MDNILVELFTQSSFAGKTDNESLSRLMDGRVCVCVFV